MSQTKVEEILRAFPNLGPEANEPTPDQLFQLLELKAGDGFCFVNLLEFRASAEYPADHRLSGQEMSGREAYNLYGQVALDHVTRRGGKLLSANSVEMQVVGVGSKWHAIVTMQYNNVDAFIDMVNDPDYQQGLVHRDAGLLHSEVFVTRALVKRPVGRFKFRLMQLARRIRGKAQ